MDDKDLLASAKVGKKGYLWLDCSYIDKWGDNRWSVVVRGKVHPIERDANGDRIFYPTAEAAARALFDAGYGPAKCQPEQNCDNCLRLSNALLAASTAQQEQIERLEGELAIFRNQPKE